MGSSGGGGAPARRRGLLCSGLSLCSPVHRWAGGATPWATAAHASLEAGGEGQSHKQALRTGALLVRLRVLSNNGVEPGRVVYHVDLLIGRDARPDFVGSLEATDGPDRKLTILGPCSQASVRSPPPGPPCTPAGTSPQPWPSARRRRPRSAANARKREGGAREEGQI